MMALQMGHLFVGLLYNFSMESFTPFCFFFPFFSKYWVCIRTLNSSIGFVERERERETMSMSIFLDFSSISCFSLRFNHVSLLQAKSPNYTAILREILPNVQQIDSRVFSQKFLGPIFFHKTVALKHCLFISICKFYIDLCTLLSLLIVMFQIEIRLLSAKSVMRADSSLEG